MNIKESNLKMMDVALFIENDYNIYKKMIEPTLKNLAKKYKKGVFDEEKALIPFIRIAKEGMKEYKKISVLEIKDMKTKKDYSCRIARELLRFFMDNINGDNEL